MPTDEEWQGGMAGDPAFAQEAFHRGGQVLGQRHQALLAALSQE